MTKRKVKINVARAYDRPAPDGSFRVLVDRLWPRGVKKEDLKLDAWMKDLAPSTQLRRWFNHDPAKWNKFRNRYFKELDAKSSKVSELLEAIGNRPIMLLFGARDQQHNQAVALRQWLENHCVKRQS